MNKEINPDEVDRDDLLGNTNDLISQEIPPGVDRRNFLMRSAVVGAAAIMTGRNLIAADRTHEAVRSIPLPLSRGLYLHAAAAGPIVITADEFYKVGPGPSSSHTIGPMRITYDFYQRCAKLPADQLAKATELRVNLFGSLSATGKGHGTERAALAGLIGMEPATVDPLFLDGLRDKPDQSFKVKLGGKEMPSRSRTSSTTLPKATSITKTRWSAIFWPATKMLLQLEYYSVGGGFIEWKGYTPPKKNAPKYPFQTMKELRAHADNNKLSIGQVILANEMSIAGKTEAEVNAFIDKIINAMLATVKSGLSMPEDGVLPGPIKLHSKAATVYKRAMDEQNLADRGIGLLSAAAIAASEENARGHLVITAPTGGSAGVMPSLVYGSDGRTQDPAGKGP